MRLLFLKRAGGSENKPNRNSRNKEHSLMKSHWEGGAEIPHWDELKIRYR